MACVLLVSILFWFWIVLIISSVGRFLSFVLFKQKTAYEMRISHWISDVCSSDLLRIPAGDGMPRAAARGRTEAAVPRDGLAAEARRKAGEHRLGQRDFGEQDERLLARFDRGGDRLHIDFGLARSGKIGRAHV